MTDVAANGVIAVELGEGGDPTRAALAQADAARLLERVAHDLAALVPEARDLDLALAAAHFDPAEALRPGWPLHRRLQELAARAPGRNDGARTIVFGADAQGEVPMPLRADVALHGGRLRVLPFVLAGDAAVVRAVAERMEDVLLDRGMAGAQTALQLQDAFGAKLEHARYLSVHDLAAITAMQYQHQGLELLWPIIETALLAPHEDAWLDQPPEPLLRLAQGEVQMALLDPAAWQTRSGAPADAPADSLARGYESFLARQRQLAAVLEAHGISVTFAYCAGDVDARTTLGG